MTTKKLVIVISSVLVVVVLLIAVFVGGIVGLTFYSIGKSEAAGTARDFLKKNEKLKQDIGTVNDFGAFITGNVNARGADGEATLSLKVIGEKRTVNANVSMAYKDNRAWRVTAASYINESGQTVNLIDAYEKDSPDN